MSYRALGANHIHRFILLKIFSTGQLKFSDFVSNYIPVGPKAPEPPDRMNARWAVEVKTEFL